MNQQCPFLMNDGRAFTDYRPSSYLNDEIKIRNNVMDSYDYRQFLINNGLKVIDTEAMWNAMP